MSESWLQTALEETSKFYGFRIDGLTKLGGGFENRTFGFETDKTKFIIRKT